MKTIKGTITGEIVRRFLEYSYRKLDNPQEINLHSIDPDRLYPSQKYQTDRCTHSKSFTIPRRTGIGAIFLISLLP